MPGPFLLRFGIPSLDRLITGEGEDTQKTGGLPNGIRLGKSESTSLCIVGPDGTGKSVLGLHLASRYASDCWEISCGHSTPRVLYVSTDLNYEVAEKRLWDAFKLACPTRRYIPFARRTAYGRTHNLPDYTVRLRPIDPLSERRSETAPSPPCETDMPDGALTMSQFLLNHEHREENELWVGFLDLARNTAGDDWGYVNRIIALLPQPQKTEPKHLIVVDAVEGFETLVGEKDAYGEPTSRRARIAQIMRLAASQNGKCNLALITEEAVDNQRVPEVFVSDFVIRLREVEANGYVRRTVQVEKARGYAHARGQHPFVIRSGKGSTTGAQPNFDDPRIERNEDGFYEAVKRFPSDAGDQNVTEEHKGEQYQAYFHVFRSLHYLSRTTMQKPGTERPEKALNQYAAFGIPYLDDMLGGEHSPPGRMARTRCDGRGLPCFSVTALIGDSETQKTRLGQSFLSRSFASFPDVFSAVTQELSGKGSSDTTSTHVNLQDIVAPFGLKPTPGAQALMLRQQILSDHRYKYFDARFRTKLQRRYSQSSNDLHEILSALSQDSAQSALMASWLLSEPGFTHDQEGVAILLTTQDIDNKQLAREFSRLLAPRDSHKAGENPWSHLANDLGIQAGLFREIAEEYFCARTICRRLEIHDLSSPILMHIVQSSIQEAQHIQTGKNELPSESNDRYRLSLGIRLVIDDFSVIKSLYPEIRGEQLFLPYLMFSLRREGITTLIINTHSEKPGTAGNDAFEQEFRTLVDYRLYTWHVPFFGRDRVAIAAIPPLANAGVRELSPAANDPRGLMVDPHFELYSGLEEGKPQPVPLEISLYQETPAFETYIRHENLLFREMFMPVPDRSAVIIGHPTHEYAALHDSCCLESRRRLDHTLILQVDEYWAVGRGALRDQKLYLDGETVDEGGNRNEAVDTLCVFQPSVGSDREVTVPPQRTSRKRKDFFSFRDHVSLTPAGLSEAGVIDRIPFAWDFGFLMCRERCWMDAEDQSLKSQHLKIGDIWRSLRKVSVPTKDADPQVDIPSYKGESQVNASGKTTCDQPAPTWRQFLEACILVARLRSSRSPSFVPAFDLSLLAPESFSCLALEMWASEIVDFNHSLKGENSICSDLAKEIDERKPGERPSMGLFEWLIGAAVDGRPDRDRSVMQDYNDWRAGSPRPVNRWWIELYKVWLLLAEVLNLKDFVEPARSLEFKPRDPDSAAVAIRQWYKTAATCSDDFDTSDPLLPCRLPGRFSVRGDWFLAVQEGSRSDRLADQALDLLSSKRANITRLQMGLGFPTRKTIADVASGSVRIKLFKCGIHGERERATYKDMLDIGADGLDFHWLWRSRLADYDRHARIFQKWLGRTMLSWTRARYDLGHDWISGFEVYDRIANNDTKWLFQEHSLKSLETFAARCDVLVAELRDATLRAEQ